MYALGTSSFREQLRSAGYPVTDRLEDDIDCLMMGFDTELTFQKLDDACRLLTTKPDLLYLATNPDWVCPTDARTILVDCGSLQKCIEAATGRKPDKVMGKPDPTMLDGIRDRNGLRPDEIAMVGDRIYTDIEMGRRAGAVSVLVLSGETTLETALEVGTADFICRDLEELGDMILESRKD
jgi:NagD protein